MSATTTDTTKSFEDLRSGFEAVGRYYDEATAKRSTERAALRESVGAVAIQLHTLHVRHDAYLKASKGRFNVFTTLLEAGDETRLHSKWLRYLLDPKASHDCGSLFLRLFISRLRTGTQPHLDDVAPDRLDEVAPFNCDDALVAREVQTLDGRLDLVIDCASWGVIAIENKIWAAEQPDQLLRYGVHLETVAQRGNRNSLLLYLTPEGKQSQTAGKFQDTYRRISYREHILDWLEDCKRATYQFVNINQALQQYTRVVSEIVGTTLNQPYMDDVIELIQEHPAIIAHLSDITGAVEKLRERFWVDFVRELRKQIGAFGIQCGPLINDKGYPKLILTNIGNLTINGHEARVAIEFGKAEAALYIGASFHHHDDKVRGDVWRHREQQNAVMDRCALEFSEYNRDHNAWWPLGFVYLRREFMTNSFVAKNASKRSQPLESQVAEIVQMVVKFISIVKDAIPHTCPPAV